MAKRTTRNGGSELPETRRRAASRRADLSGLDLDPEEPADDEEYSEAPADENDDSMMAEDDEISPKKRKRKADDDEDLKDDGDDGEEDDGEGDGEEEEEVEEEGEEEGDDNGHESSSSKKSRKQMPKKRGRKRTKLTMAEDGAYYDDDGNLLKVENDEVVIENEDPKGKEKIDEYGNLQGDRKFVNKTFTVLGQGDRKYMISTEPARLVGFRDSYLLFKTHNKLFKKVCTNEEKMNLIERNIIPNSYKGRSVNLVTARSIFREFGAKILENGKKVIDDFWEQKARDNGDVEGEFADPTELFNYNMSRNALGYEGISNNQPSNLSGAPLYSYQTDPTWMYQIGLKTRELNSRLLEGRSEAFSGIKDTYTGQIFVPSGTQASSYKISKIGDAPSGTIIIDTKFSNPNIRQKSTNLMSIPEKFLNLVDEETKQAIQAQIEYEKLL